MRIEDTGGNVTYIIHNCDCGLTGDCEKCQPIYIPRIHNTEYIFPEAHEENFIDPGLEAFYRKKGYLRDDETWKEYRIRAIRDKSHRDLGEAWQILADI